MGGTRIAQRGKEHQIWISTTNIQQVVLDLDATLRFVLNACELWLNVSLDRLQYLK